MTPTHVGGLDTSTARIGYATPTGEVVSITAPAGADDPNRRLHQLWRGIVRVIRAYPPIPDLVAIEGYSLGMMTVTKATSTGTHKTPTGVLSKIRLGEVGGIARLACFELDIPIVDIPPSSLKLFATSRGNADKEAMRKAAIARGVRGSVNHDEADAWHARRMARAAHGLEGPLADHELTAISKLVW